MFMKFLRLGGGWESLCVWMEEGLLSKCMEVTPQESTAANPEYGDFLCVLEAEGLAAFGGALCNLTLLLGAMDRQ